MVKSLHMWQQSHHFLDESNRHQYGGKGCHSVTFTDKYCELPWFHCHGSDWPLCRRLSRVKWSQMVSIDYISWAYFKRSQCFFFTGIICSDRQATFRQISPSSIPINSVSLLEKCTRIHPTTPYSSSFLLCGSLCQSHHMAVGLDDGCMTLYECSPHFRFMESSHKKLVKLKIVASQRQYQAPN